MVPSLFVFLNALPLTANNKVDRQALPAPASALVSDAVHVAPTDRMDVQMAALWQRVFGINHIGIHDNFFDLGGHSLKAAQLFYLIEQVYGRHLPLSTLFQAPTIATLTSLLAHEHWTPPWQSLVAIQPSGTAIPIFMVPGVGGNVLVFSQLAKVLGPNQPSYGLQARGLDGKEAPFTSVPEMASHYITQIRSVLPNGPYVVLGSCTGGLIAYEMAQQLLEQGQAVTLIVMDTWHPSSYRPHRYEWPTRFAIPLFMLWRTIGTIRTLFRLPIQDWRPFIQHKAERLRSLSQSTDDNDELLVELRVERVTQATRQAVARYAIRKYPGRILNIVASKRNVARSVTDTRHVWPEFGGGGSKTVQVAAINAGHLLTTPHVEEVTKHLLGFLGKDTQHKPVILANVM
jgi:thioesterase domain-containing protein/acyl carrier protein